MDKERLKTKYAAFDLDGTLIRWQLYHAIIDELISLNLLTNQQIQIINKYKQDWKNRRTKESFEKYEKHLINETVRIIYKINSHDFNQICQNVFNIYKDQVHSYTLNLIKNLQAKNYAIFFISGSPNNIVKLIAKYYKIDDFAGSNLNDNNAKSQVIIMTGQQKLKTLKQLITKHNLNNKDSYAVGDTLGDQYILDYVENPIAFNPNQALFNLAQAKHWEIVVERKNVNYQLNYQDHRYVLAKTKH